ncbi:MAG TPA: hypothetical protein VGF95_08430 [Solirubrobacteraceae bacterium]
MSEPAQQRPPAPTSGQATTYGPLRVARHVKDDGRTLILYSRERSGQQQAGASEGPE